MNGAIQDPTRELQDIQLGEFPNSGGLPIVVNKQMIGAVGVGGSAPKPPVWSDEICAHKALTEVIGASVPPLLEDLPRRREPPIPAPRRFLASPPRRLPRRACPRNSSWAARARATSSTAIRFRSRRQRRSPARCRDWAASKGDTMSLYVLDNAGEFVHMERMDGQVSNNIRTALLKAQTALKTRQPTSIRAAQLKNDPGGLPRSTVISISSRTRAASRSLSTGR